MAEAHQLVENPKAESEAIEAAAAVFNVMGMLPDAVPEASGLLAYYYALYGPEGSSPAIGRSPHPRLYAPGPLSLAEPAALMTECGK